MPGTRRGVRVISRKGRPSLASNSLVRRATRPEAPVISITGKSLTGLGAAICSAFCSMFHSFIFRSRKALPMTETELMLIAAPAIIGLSSKPKNG